MRSATRRNPPSPTPTPHTGPFVMCVEFPTPKANEPTIRIPYEQVQTAAEAVAWIKHPPLPPEALKKLKKGVLLTARVQTEWVTENGQYGEEIAAMGIVLHVGTKNHPTKIVVVTRDGITVDKKAVVVSAPWFHNKAAGVPGFSKKSANGMFTWLYRFSSANGLLEECGGVPRQLLVLTSCAIARTVLHLVPKSEERPRIAVETAEAWAQGSATIDQVIAAWHDAELAWKAASATARATSMTTDDTRTAWATGAAKEAVRTATVSSPTGAAIGTAGSARAVDITADELQRIVRNWISLPEVAFAKITTNK